MNLDNKDIKFIRSTWFFRPWFLMGSMSSLGGILLIISPFFILKNLNNFQVKLTIITGSFYIILGVIAFILFITSRKFIKFIESRTSNPPKDVSTNRFAYLLIIYNKFLLIISILGAWKALEFLRLYLIYGRPILTYKTMIRYNMVFATFIGVYGFFIFVASILCFALNTKMLKIINKLG